MKICVFLAYTCALISTKNTFASLKGTIHAPLGVISLDDISPEERKQIAYLEYKLNRSKRSGSGSGDILGALAKAIGQGLKKKIGQIAKASVSASGHFSSSSSGGHSSDHSYSYHHPEHHPEHVPEYDHKSFDFWSLKKSILNTLLQAVKAIKGGVIAVKGQLIKGSGKLISVKGRLISAKGESITQLGKNIASSAVLVPFHGHPSSGHGEYHHSAPSAPEEIYHEAPSGPGYDYHVPDSYPPPHHPEADGLLILKKMRQHHEDVPPFRPLEPAGPSFGTIVGKFFSASTTLDPHKPEPFGNTASGGTVYEHNEIEHKAPPPTTSYGTPFEEAPGYVNPNFGDYAASDSKTRPSYVKVGGHQNSVGGAGDKHSHPDYVQPLLAGLESTKNSFEYPTRQTSEQSALPGGPASSNVNTPADSLPNSADYPSYVKVGGSRNLVGGAGEKHSHPDYVQPLLAGLESTKNSFEYPTRQASEQFGLLGGPASPNANPPADSLPNLADYPDGFPPSSNDFQSVGAQAASSAMAGAASPIYIQQSHALDSWAQMSKPSPFLETPQASILFRSPSSFNKLEPFPSSPRQKTRSSSYKRPSVGKGLSSFRTRRPDFRDFELVKSMSFELGPNGPKRLT